MSDHIKATVYFVVGFFTPEQREQRDRGILFDKSHAIPAATSHGLSTKQTVYRLRSQSEEVDLFLDAAVDAAVNTLPARPVKRGTGSFRVERLMNFPAGKGLKEAFDEFMQGDGKVQFGDATLVQLFSVDVELNPPPPSK
jgi:hypothetical protein